MRACAIAPLMAFLLAGGTQALAEDAAAREARQKFEAVRPAEADLAMYRLDWANSLEEAQRRAAKEGRPVFLVVIHAKYGNLYTGHC